MRGERVGIEATLNFKLLTFNFKLRTFNFILNADDNQFILKWMKFEMSAKSRGDDYSDILKWMMISLFPQNKKPYPAMRDRAFNFG